MQRASRLCYALGLCGLCSCAGPSTTEVYRDGNVRVTERLGWSFLSPHRGSDTISIFIFGKKYRDVRGSDLYYLEVAEKHSILFVTGPDHNGSGNAVVHVVNLHTREERHCRAYDSHIGSNICSLDKQTEQRFERVESV